MPKCDSCNKMRINGIEFHEVGYAYEAALHCPDCTAKRFDPMGIDKAVDREGNIPSPVFAGDEPGDTGDYCDDCHEPLDNMPDDWDAMLLDCLIVNNRADMLTVLKAIVSDLKQQISGNPAEYTECGADAPSIDIRLCVDINGDGYAGTWIFRTGLVDYDPAHSEYCGASCVGLDTDVSELLDDLIDQVKGY